MSKPTLQGSYSGCLKLFLLSILLFTSPLLRAEGTAQWMPVGMPSGQELTIMVFNGTDGNGRLGTTGCDSLERIFIAVSDNFANERIYVGMNVFDNVDTHFRIMAPDGTQVYPTTPGQLQEVLGDGPNNFGEGFIDDLTEARNGPEEVFGAGGYDAISVTPTMAGNYYIEFNGSNSTSFVNNGRHQISYFDVTVANTNGLPEGLGNHTAINGRLFSHQWGLYNLLDGTGFNDVDVTYYVYQTQDSIVTAIEWDQVKPGGWDILFTSTGLANTGDYFADRQSQPYSVVPAGSFIGEYPIFWNDPDSTIWQSATVPPELVFFDYERCAGTTCFLYQITKGGQIEVLLDFNENGVFDPGTEDVLLVDNQPAGIHCLSWDNEDGLGTFILSGQAQVVLKYQAGIMHMPLGDVEDNDQGFNRQLIRPILTGTEEGQIYHDHTQANDFGPNDYEYEGCSSDCNIWDGDDGNQQYLNTWLSYAEVRDTLFTIFDGCDGDGDGLTDDFDIDDDNDGIPDIVEMYRGDHDMDGIPDYEDAQFCLDVYDGVSGWDCADGLPDPSGDIDGDGVTNARDINFPGCIEEVNFACRGFDSDGDGRGDYIDVDSDNDGIPDIVEAGGVDTDGNGIIDDLTDDDLDGLADDYDNDNTDGINGSSPCAPLPGCLRFTSTNVVLDPDGDGVTEATIDTDGDGFFDWVDLDADNDGIPDVVEAGGTDEDGDGIADNFADGDRDGLNDVYDGEVCVDTNANGTGTWLNNVSGSVGVNLGGFSSGFADAQFAEIYQASDLLVLDLGSVVPQGTKYVVSWRRKGSYSFGPTADMEVEESTSSPTSGFTTHSVTLQTTSITDVVRDTIFAEKDTRYLRFSILTDTDDDVDFDAVKYLVDDTICQIPGNPLQLTGADGNNDGVPDSYPEDDFDGDGIRNQLDLDADNDGIPDVVEAGGTDADGDGYADDYVDTDSDGFNDVVDGDVGNDEVAENTANALLLTGADGDGDGVPDDYPTDDFDGDGNLDFLDLDADNDGIPDVVEAGGVDTDGDGIFDDQTDSDNDGFADDVDGDVGNDLTAENSAQALILTGSDGDNDGAPDDYPNGDTDSDGNLDHLDLDADNDGIPDVVEAGGVDEDGDGFFDDQTDSDGDGFADDVDGDVGNDGTAENTAQALQVTDTDGDNDGAPDSIINDDTDGDGIPDQLDLDADNDGIPDVVEAGGVDEDGDGIFDDQTDTDGDGFADDVDGDVGNDGTAENTAQALQITDEDGDNDGAPDGVISDDTDGDGISDQLDLDADNDGIPDVVEAGGVDTDGDGIFDDQTDTDGDGFADDVDGDVGNDGIAENSAQALLLTGPDGNNDGAPDSYTDDDGDDDDIPNHLDLDSDNDGIPDVVEAGGVDTDGDGFFDNQTDTDGDGFSDIVDGDVGNDGTAENSADALQLTGADGDNDGAPDSYPNDDFDDDGIRDQLDLDADNDGIPDVVEAGGTDTDGDGFFDDQTDTDGDGFADDVDGDVGNDGTAENSADALQLTGPDGGSGAPDSYPEGDTDGDGNLDQLDLDADNDGIPDVVEAGGVDADGDGFFDDQTDSDNDGFADDVDGDVGNDLTAENTAQALQVTGADTDNDGAPNSFPSDDPDGDGIPNQLDLDSDNDGITDVLEAGGDDANEDGRIDNNTTDIDNDGFTDDVDGDVGNDGTAENTVNALIATGSDTDNDGTPNSFPNGNSDDDNLYDFIDIDADNDGIVDNTESQSTAGYILNAGSDTDGDGLDNAYDPDNGGTYINPVDTDSDGTPDYLDLDTDNDGLLDELEGHDSDRDFFADSGSPANTGLSGGTVDADSDGLYDGWDNNTSVFDPGNGTLNPSSHPNVDDASTSERDWREVKDTDNDGVPDITDIDDDNDGITDVNESFGNDPDGDEDGDGIINFLDTLDNGNGGDGSITNYMDEDGNGFPDVYEFDDDGIPSHLDKDADGDGIVDIIEAQGTDPDEDGEVEYDTPGDPTTMVDLDNDGLWDTVDDTVGVVTDGTPWVNPNTDGAGNQNFLDIDADDDGIVDNTEAQATGSYISPLGTDTDVDGIDDAYDPDDGGTYIVPVNTEGTGGEDYIDTDTDDDGEADSIEGHDVDGDGTADTLSPSNTGVSGGLIDVDGDGLLDGWDNDTTSRDPTNDGLSPSSHPNADAGGTERDWREVPCENGVITLAPNNTTTTASDYCVENGWRYYYDPLAPTELLFAIEHTPAGGNTNEFTAEIDISVSVNPLTEAGVYSAEDVGNGDAAFVMGRYYNINITSGSLNGFVNIRFYYDTDESDTLFAVADRWNDDNAGGTGFVSGLRWFVMNSGTFDPNTADLQPNGIQDSDDRTPNGSDTEDGVAYVQFQLSSLTGGGLGYVVGSNSTSLPVEWLYFEATKSGDEALLEWATATEKNADRYIIQRAVDGENFMSIGEVEANGTTTSQSNYDYIDSNPVPGVNYYRIMQVDEDGTYTLTATEVLEFGKGNVSEKELLVYPNPNNGEFTVLLPYTSSWNVLIYDQTGQKVYDFSFSETEMINQLNLRLSSGIYNLVVSDQSGRHTAIVNVIR